MLVPALTSSPALLAAAAAAPCALFMSLLLATDAAEWLRFSDKASGSGSNTSEPWLSLRCRRPAAAAADVSPCCPGLVDSPSCPGLMVSSCLVVELALTGRSG